MQRHFEQEILRISLFIYYKNLHFAQDFSGKMSNNFSLVLKSIRYDARDRISGWVHMTSQS